MKKMKVCMFIMFVLLVTSCGYFSRFVGAITGTSRICVEGVSYLQFTSGASVEYTTEGKIQTCK